MTQGYHILVYSIGYFLFFALVWVASKKNGNRLVSEKGIVSNRSMIIILQIGGILLFGVIPFYFLNQDMPDVIFGKSAPSGLQITVTIFLAILTVIFSLKQVKKEFRLQKSNITANSSFDGGFITSYFIVRILFLCAYDIWFRGYLLADYIPILGIPLAILINIIFYVLIHSVNGKKEMIACVPFGLLLCGLCIWIGAAWPAIVVHLALAVPYESYLVKKINEFSVFSK